PGDASASLNHAQQTAIRERCGIITPSSDKALPEKWFLASRKQHFLATFRGAKSDFEPFSDRA
ncbi:MAG: hypothetical protein ACF788_12385, partial [Novipirellula sp. JB048]